MLEVYQIVNTPVSSNCFILYNKTVGNGCVIVDPGSESNDVLLGFLKHNSLTPTHIILTHEHFDHCWGVNDLVTRYHLPIICSQKCAECIKSFKKNCSVFYDNSIRFTIESETISIEDLEYKLDFYDSIIKFINTPGHSEASICFHVNNMLFTGDTLIKGEKTVTKLPTSSKEKLVKTLEILREFSNKEYMVFPGHGVIFELSEDDILMAQS